MEIQESDECAQIRCPGNKSIGFSFQETFQARVKQTRKFLSFMIPILDSFSAAKLPRSELIEPHRVAVRVSVAEVLTFCHRNVDN